MKKKKITCDAQANIFSRVDSEFQSKKTLTMEEAQIVESCIQNFGDGLESLSKSGIKNLNCYQLRPLKSYKLVEKFINIITCNKGA